MDKPKQEPKLLFGKLSKEMLNKKNKIETEKYMERKDWSIYLKQQENEKPSTTFS